MAPLEYVNTGSTFRKFNGQTVEDKTEEWELAITLKPGELSLLIGKLDDILKRNGELGARLVLYTSPRKNKTSGEVFASTSIIVQDKLPQKPGTSGNFSARDGRRQYPAQTPAVHPTPQVARAAPVTPTARPPIARTVTPPVQQPAKQSVPAGRPVARVAKDPTPDPRALEVLPVQEYDGPPEPPESWMEGI